MYEVEFYRDKNDKSEIVEYLDSLKEKGETDKNERVSRDKILAYIMALKEYGTRIGQPVVKHIDGSLWELRPLRTAYFSFTGKIINSCCYITSLRSRRKRRRGKLTGRVPR
jgi:phage-related protein